MPFDPKSLDPRVVHPDQPPLRPDGELDLPADLAVLAEQLADDAARLAARYPANRRDFALPADVAALDDRTKNGVRTRPVHVWGAVIAGVGLASLAGLTLTIVPQLRNGSRTGPENAGRSASVATVNATPGQAPDVEGSEAIRPSVTLSLGELSGPELEGLFDLLDDSSTSAASISF